MNDNDESVPCLKCDIELDLGASISATVNKRTANVLRDLADRIERDDLETGHHPVTDNVGKEVGTIYLDHYGVE